MKRLLVVVDMQNDFITGAIGTSEAQEILPAVAQLIEEARRRGDTVVFTRDTHGEDYLSTQEGKKLPVVHCVKGTKGWEIADGLQKEGDIVLDKPSFGSPELARYVKENGFSRILFCGVCTDICVVSNALLVKAFCPEAELAVAARACAGTSPANHDAAIATMRCCQIEVV